MSQDHSFRVLTKCRITMHNNQFMLLLYDMKRKLLACFYPLKVLCNTSFVSTINGFSSFFFNFSYCISMLFYLGYFSKRTEIMNVNRCISSVSKICYDKIDDYGQLCTFLLNYWPWCLCNVLFTWFFISDRLLGCQDQPLLERYAWNLNMSFVNTICLWKSHTFMWQSLEERDLWLALQKSIFCLWLRGQIRWGLHWIVER